VVRVTPRDAPGEGGVGRHRRDTAWQPSGGGRIPEIEGLRGLAIVVIIVYHVWFRRVSGGVDVFLLLSGFLVTLSLLRTVERQGRVRFLAHYARTFRRILPPAMVTLVGVIVATVLFLPRTRWQAVASDVAHAAIQDVNWHLAFGAVDYLASREAASPVQHYWSLAIQNQFYVVWPVLITLVIIVGRWLRIPRRLALALVIGGLFAASLAYSLKRTPVDQAFTYFDSFARVYELALGALLALALPFLRLGRWPRAVLGWAGLVMLMVCGFVFPGTAFPGWAALWPTVAAVLIILSAPAGESSAPGIGRVLRSRPLTWLGGLSYALYLWHWPILICFLSYTDRGVAGRLGGTLVVLASFAVAIPSRWLVETLLLGRTSIGQRTPVRGFGFAGSFLVVAVAASLGLGGYTDRQRELDLAAASDPVRYPGAAYLVNGGELPDVPFRPSLFSAKSDLPELYDRDCQQKPREPEPIVCEFGRPDASLPVALVGGSHSAQWLPALQAVANDYDWRIISITKSACRFQRVWGELSTPEKRSCSEWNAKVLPLLAQLRPDVVFTTSTAGRTAGTDRMPGSYIPPWRDLAAIGIPVIAIRDNPWHRSDPTECVARLGPRARECGADRHAHGLDEPPAVPEGYDLPTNVTLLDFTDYLCGPDFCPAVIGNVLVYRDRHHLSATYVRTIGPYLGQAVAQAMGWERG